LKNISWYTNSTLLDYTAGYESSNQNYNCGQKIITLVSEVNDEIVIASSDWICEKGPNDTNKKYTRLRLAL